MKNNTIDYTSFNFPKQKSFYKGKVRDVYNIDDELLVMITTDRISAFDVVLPEAIPYKGQVLNQIAEKFLDATEDIVPNWKIVCPHPSVTIGRYCKPFSIEMIVRGYLTGSSWRLYKSGGREICGEPLPEGLKEHQKFPQPILTPTTKADEGHDEDISREEIIRQGLVSEEDYNLLSDYALKLFERGTEIAKEKGLILVDTKYEFGKANGKIYLIDEVHTPDSSRYFYADTYQTLFDKGEQQRQLSKEFVREWLMKNDFQGKEGETMPEMNDEFIQSVSDRYIELFEKITGEKFQKNQSNHIIKDVEQKVSEFLKTYYR